MEKAVKDHSLRSLNFVAIGKQQKAKDFDEIIQWAAVHGVKVTVFLDWRTLYQACKCFAPVADDVYEGRVFRRVLARAASLGVSQTGIAQFHALAT